jgi:coenzyme PQQ precursor peptide PqqA
VGDFSTLLRRRAGSTILICVCQRQPQITLEEIMAWTTPTLVEICIGLEINGYLPAEF